jgi:lauroyl/myristoyl acyltransferase
MIDHIRHLQSVVPFETFATELANGRVIQVHDKHQVATTEGARNGEGVIGVLYHGGIFELINARQIASVSVGLHPKVKADLSERMESARKGFEGRTEAAQ